MHESHLTSDHRENRMSKNITTDKSRYYLVSDLLDPNETNPSDGILGHSAAYKSLREAQAEITAAKLKLKNQIAELNKVLQNEWLVGTAVAFAKKKHLRAARCFELDSDGSLLLVCDGIERKVTKRYTHKVETMAQLRQRGNEMGIDIDALGLGVQRRKIAAHLDEMATQRKRIAKMVRTGDAVAVTVA